MSDIMFFISEHIMLSSIWFFFLISLIFLMTKNIFLSSSKIIDNMKAIKLINKDHAIVIDTRDLRIFKKGHIVNSIHFPLKSIFSGNLEEIKEYKNLPIILILTETYKQHKCIKELLKHEFKNVYILKNGIYNWSLDHLPLVTKQ